MDVSRNEESHVSVTTSLFMALLKAEKYEYLKSITQCNDFSLADCFLMYRLQEDFKECPKNCTLINFLNHTLDLKYDSYEVKGKRIRQAEK